MQTILTVLLGLLTLLAVSLQRTYARVPLKQLKHRARQGDGLAAAMLKAVGFGHSLRAVLWFLVGLTSAGFFVMIAQVAPPWFALAASGVLVWLGFVWLPAARVTFISERIAAWCAPMLAKLLNYLHPVLDRIITVIHKHRPVRVHTGLYDRQDLIDLLEQQQVQPDSRIERAELEIALHALKFGDDTVIEHMTPRRMVKAVSIEAPLGPVVMDELHASGHSRFPVYEGKPDNIVGTLYLRDLVRAKNSGTVQKLTKPDVAYVHEDQSLYDALQAILRTHHQLFIVVNSFEEYVGIITIEDVLEAIIGSPIIDEFDQYDDLRAVAARAARREHKQHSEPAKPEQEEEPLVEPETETEAPASIPEEHIDETIEL
ncbi:MAG TPA: CBS domain-containing protein [Patescibacteria group bacterium]|nr:CBS domain-containing protein [Patescibacteria group bacterium]